MTPDGPAPTAAPAALTAVADRPSPLRAAIAAATRAPEPELVPGLVDAATLSPAVAETTRALALRLARGVRERGRASGRAGLVQGLLQEFALDSQEGVALMCLAEALLRIPDRATRDALIRDKLGDGDWRSHLGQSPSLFVNAAAWGLVVTGRLVATHSDSGLGATLRRVLARGGEPLVRKGVDLAMRLMGEQFVTGETIRQALANARPREAEGFRYSYDMLGEAALTAGDAARYLRAYEQAIDAIGEASAGRGIVAGPGISIKLSALHPRYVRSQRERVMQELYPRLLGLAVRARGHDIGLNIDAEESERLELSLDLLERLCHEPALAGWNGIGFVIQAYQKRCPAVVDWLIDLGRRSGHRLMVRLVKGAYWDSEIKRAQLDGLSGYPVYTRKPYTDLAYIACARKLLAAPDAVFPQFATHNAQTLAAIHTLAGPVHDPGQYEFQCLHGMGESLYEQIVGHGRPRDDGGPADPRRPCRIYAPVGTHETLLAYLVRRLLENGANTSFVNRIADETLPLDALVEDPVATVRDWERREGRLGAPHPAIPGPVALYGGRRNSSGLDLTDEATLAAIDAALAGDDRNGWTADPMLAPGSGSDLDPAPVPARHANTVDAALPVRNPASTEKIVGTVREATLAEVEQAIAAAVLAAPGWAAVAPTERAAALQRAADALEADRVRLVPLLIRESGKSRANAVAEVREAVDFLRYYAAGIARDFLNATHRPLGAVVCISPWNFPLAIFTGQIAAALAAGNVVLAKPAEQTPLIAAEAVRHLHAAGVPPGALQFLPGRGDTVGAGLVDDPRVQGVLFTGSTDVARRLQRSLAGRLTARGQPVPLVAETGGQNAMLVDSSALVEQAVIDIVVSAFDSAGQRCSALRVLCVQQEAAPRLVEMLRGAVDELRLGDPAALATDVGPVIDAEARENIERHLASMRAKGRAVWQPAVDPAAIAPGYFVAPTIIEIESLAELEREVFGPVLHLLRYRRDRLAETLAAIGATGYGLTLGVHTRIDETVAEVVDSARVGNVYVNRNIVGAVVGVQPFGGEGLSGTGPKAGGPLLLLRLLADHPADAARHAVVSAGHPADAPVRGRRPERATPASETARRWGAAEPAGPPPMPGPLDALRRWAEETGDENLADACRRDAAASPVGRWIGLAGPTGEANLYQVAPREAVLGLAEGPQADADRLRQLAAVLSVGSRMVWGADAAGLRARLPEPVRPWIRIASDPWQPGVPFDAVIVHAPVERRIEIARRLAERPGPIVAMTGGDPGDPALRLEALVTERSLSINTAAAGGNASLMTIE